MPDNRPKLPELLSPAGSPEALEAAFLAGADAVYLGGSRFNARRSAHNFDSAQLKEAVTHAHRMGGRVYLTLNTLLWDRELTEALDAAYEAAEAGVDALIVADLGIAALIRRSLPSLPIHASTQLSGHNASAGRVLADFGFSRFVIARETSFEDLVSAVRNNPLEVEVFIHGALCVSHSGQCLFSSLVGGRSGNRGECAQPCRLPYGCGGCSADRNRPKGTPYGGGENYPLSLKDLSLAAHVPALIEAGVSSLKIEGRMKSPAYVSGVTAVWRRLLDERRRATVDEMGQLADLFSRGGFTDGYQLGRIDRSMMGIRSEADKDRTASAEKAALAVKHPPHLPLSMTFTAGEDQPVSLTVTAPLFRCDSPDPAPSVTVFGDTPSPALNAPLTPEAAEKQLSRTGGTPYRAVSVTTHIAEGLMLPLSRLNALRRDALEGLDAVRMGAMPTPADGYTPLSPHVVAEEILSSVPRTETGDVTAVRRTACFRAPEQIPQAAASYFDVLYLPLGKTHPAAVSVGKRGVLLPPVIFDREAAAVTRELICALEGGIRHILVGNIGHLPLIRRAAEACGLPADALHLHGDLRLNPSNTLAAAGLLSLGLSDLILAPELTIPRMRDIAAALSAHGHPTATAAVIYGRLPLMLLEKCAIREIYRHKKPDAVCREICSRDAARLMDRMGKEFPVLREASPDGKGHRNVVCNALPIVMSDRMDEVIRAHTASHHYLFTVESPAEVERVIAAYGQGTPLGGEIRRMVK